MKKIIAIVLSICISITLSGCHLLYKSWTGKRPCDQPNTSWVSEDGSIYFHVDKEQQATGEMIVNKERIQFVFVNGPGIEMRIYDIKSNEFEIRQAKYQYEHWIGKFKKDEFTAKVLETTYFEEGQKIKFYRVDE